MNRDIKYEPDYEADEAEEIDRLKKKDQAHRVI